MTIIPQNSYVLCKQLQGNKKEVVINGFSYQTDDVPLYKIVSIGSKVDNTLNLKQDDIVLFQTSGTKMTIDNNDLYLFDSKNFLGKVS